jgi:hypothetical protein
MAQKSIRNLFPAMPMIEISTGRIMMAFMILGASGIVDSQFSGDLEPTPQRMAMSSRVWKRVSEMEIFLCSAMRNFYEYNYFIFFASSIFAFSGVFELIPRRQRVGISAKHVSIPRTHRMAQRCKRRSASGSEGGINPAESLKTSLAQAALDHMAYLTGPVTVPIIIPIRTISDSLHDKCLGKIAIFSLFAALLPQTVLMSKTATGMARVTRTAIPCLHQVRIQDGLRGERRVEG